MRDTRGSGGDSFYAQAGGARPAFSPGNAAPFSVPRSEPAAKRVRSSPVKALLTWAVVLTAGAIGVQHGYPFVMEKVHAKEIAAVTADLQDIARGEETYQRLYGTYTADLSALGVPATLNHVTVVSASASGYCLRGESLTGGITRWMSPALGVSERACG